MPKQTLIIGVSGPSGSGKSLLASSIVQELGSNRVAVISEDNYYKDLAALPMNVREQMNFDHPESLDHVLLSAHLDHLLQGKAIDVPLYDHSTHARLDKSVTVKDYDIIVLEGILIFTDAGLRSKMGIRIFMDTPLDICLIRRLKRDVNERGRTVPMVLQQYQDTVRPMYFQFIEPYKRYADLIVPRGGQNHIAIDLIKTKLQTFLDIAD